MNFGRGAVLGVGALVCLASAPLVRAETPSGYAFDKPQVLTQQLIWGIAHGVRLLAAACQRRGDEPAGAAYLAWQDSQRPRLLAAQRDLARHYFAAEQASEADLDTALKLPATLKPRDQELGPACATLPEALGQPRYDLEKFYAVRRAAILKGDPYFPGAIWEEPADGVLPAASVSPAPAAEAPTKDTAPANGAAVQGNHDDARPTESPADVGSDPDPKR